MKTIAVILQRCLASECARNAARRDDGAIK